LDRPNLASFSQLILELISGSVDRHVFTECELELLLDLQTCAIRKSSRSDILRRYLKAVQQHSSEDASAPFLRFSVFIEKEHHDRAAAHSGHHARVAAAASRPSGKAVGSVPALASSIPISASGAGLSSK
jgi:hypothetical protein